VKERRAVTDWSGRQAVTTLGSGEPGTADTRDRTDPVYVYVYGRAGRQEC
jgi:hypothetical protein